jgi:uncharacterized ferredoxin-like protein
MWAQVTRQRTAMSETALCDEHNTRMYRREFRVQRDAETGESVSAQFINVSGNEALECGVCGHQEVQ